MVKELKKELSKLSGVDFYNPKYRDVFKKYFPNENNESENDNEEERLKEVVGDDSQENIPEAVNEENVEAGSEEQDETENIPDIESQEDNESSVEEETLEDKTEDAEEASNEETTEKVEETTSYQEPETNQELLEAKVELELVKSGVREDRLEPAKKLFMTEIKSLDDLDKLKDLIKEYPEWVKKNKVDTKPFGMLMGSTGESLTEEEKKLKAMGIDPRV